MEPGGPLTPGTSHGPPASDCTSQPSCCPDVSDGLMSARCAGDKGPERSDDADAGSGARRRFRSSAFPSSLSWDSDSGKETPDEDELQHFSNPHGLAAHSPGSPSSGLRLDSEEERRPEKQPTPDPDPVEVPNKESTNTREPSSSHLGPTLPSDSEVWSVSDGAELFLPNVKPKERCQMEAEEEAEKGDGEKSLKGKETTEPKRDVYTFPGDSDPESPPPAPWAHCTFIQRCKKKRVLLRPFSGLGNMKRTVPEAGKWARASLLRSKTAATAQLSRGGGVYDFEEAGFEGGLEGPAKFADRGGKKGDEEESVGESQHDIFTCVECSIYFRKQVHLQEHMVEHCRGVSGGSRRSGKGGRFRCVECGCNLPHRLALADHHKRHQESRLKILEEIEKLNEKGKTGEIQKPDSKVPKPANPDPVVTQEPSSVSTPGTGSDPEIVTSPPLSPDPVSTPEADPAVVDSDTSPPTVVRSATQARPVAAYRRRFVCNKCNFSTRTPQALANHSKTHNRKKPTVQTDPPSPGSQSCLLTTPLACGHCAFLTSSQTLLREHQKLVHPGEVANSGEQTHGSRQYSRSNVGARISKPVLHSDDLSDSGSLSDAGQGKHQPGAPEDGTARLTGRLAGRRVFNRRFSRRGKIWPDLDKFHSRLDDHKLPGSEEEEEHKDPSAEPDAETPRQMADSPGRVKLCSTDERSAAVSPKTSTEDEDDQEVGGDGKAFSLRRSSRVAAATADGDDADEERVRRFLAEGVSDEDGDEVDEDAEALKSVERKCPYCPDRFHNGIGLANHVRGHLNRVGVSYNVRHFISPEEVNAIEKKFSYQKKKKKVANFDPDTFSVMHCEFCGAGFDTRAGLSSHARAHLRDFGITNWDVTISPIHILRELFSSRPDLVLPTAPPRSLSSPQDEDEEEEEEGDEGEGVVEVKLEGETVSVDISEALPSAAPQHWKEEEEEEEEEEEGGGGGKFL